MVKAWWYHNDGLANFGDMMSPWLVRHITKQWVTLPKMHGFFKEEHYFIIGSILANTNAKSIVWGSGMLHPDQPVLAKKFHAVRGPHTRNSLLKANKVVPEVYGDPAILAPRYFNPTNVSIKYETAIIPHIVDYQQVKEIELKNNTGRLVINLLDSIETVIEQIKSSKRVLSSSLHGVIVAHAYRVPVIWVKFSDKLKGSDHNFKFHDYFGGVESEFYNAIELRDGVPNEKEVDAFFEKLSKNTFASDKLESIADKLYANCPFK